MLLTGIIGFLAVGISLGMLGGGGSILAVPILVHGLGFSASAAVPMSLPVVGIAAAIGAVLRWRKGDLQISTALAFAFTAMIAAYAAARLGSEIPDRPRLLLFVAVMITAAVAMWRRAQKTGKSDVSQASKSPPKLHAAAAITGTLTGLVGVGGGFLIVPALSQILGMSMPRATATSLAVIAMNSAAASIGWHGRSDIDVSVVATITAVALVGMLIGTRIASRLTAQTLARGFAGLLMLVAATMLVLELKA